MRIPAMNEVVAQTGSEEPKYPDEPEDKRYMILYPEDYTGFGNDVAGNVALLVDKEQAKEVKRLAENVIKQIEAESAD